jgi:hypothetical protein
MTAETIVEFPFTVQRFSGFADWRGRLDRERIPPVIAVAGSRGKTSVLRVVESMLRAGDFRFASWTDGGVEIEGQRQRGEIGPWSRVRTRLTSGGLDVALREIDWATLRAVGAPGGSYPLVAVSNLCANNEACLIAPEIAVARSALGRIRESVGETGRLVLNADDFAVSGYGSVAAPDRYLVGISADTPVLRRHMQLGGDSCYLDDDTIVIREDQIPTSVASLRDLGWTRRGAIPFAAQNALIATAIARGCGLSLETIRAGLEAHSPQPALSPGSFNVFELGSSLVVVDRPAPSWFLRTTLRAVTNLGGGRHIRLAGPMVDVYTDDLFEVGRLLGRVGGVLIAHGAWSDERLNLFRSGASSNDVPPLFLMAADELGALRQALGMLRTNDVLLMLAENPSPAIRQIERRRARLETGAATDVGAA